MRLPYDLPILDYESMLSGPDAGLRISKICSICFSILLCLSSISFICCKISTNEVSPSSSISCTVSGCCLPIDTFEGSRLRKPASSPCGSVDDRRCFDCERRRLAGPYDIELLGSFPLSELPSSLSLPNSGMKS
jgi:hypothetical protein